MDPEERANELADTFRAKAKLPLSVINAYTALPVHRAIIAQIGFLNIRIRTLKIVRDLDEHLGTGPDFLPARILKRCAAEFAYPVTLLARKLPNPAGHYAGSRIGSMPYSNGSPVQTREIRESYMSLHNFQKL